jgi:hypothetical protein
MKDRGKGPSPHRGAGTDATAPAPGRRGPPPRDCPVVDLASARLRRDHQGPSPGEGTSLIVGLAYLAGLRDEDVLHREEDGR